MPSRRPTDAGVLAELLSPRSMRLHGPASHSPCCLLCLTASAPHVRYNFNRGWLLNLGDPAAASDPSFDDSGWKRVMLPHAWNEGFAYRVSIHDQPTGIAWYRKHFTVAVLMLIASSLSSKVSEQTATKLLQLSVLRPKELQISDLQHSAIELRARRPRVRESAEPLAAS